LAQAYEFGVKVYVHLQDAGKLEARAEEAIFVGVDDQSKGYWVYWLGKRRISVERNISFVPTTITVAADVPIEGEKASLPVSNDQHVSTPTPSTPLKLQMQLPEPTAPRATRIRPPIGYYKTLNEGESASIVIIPEEDREDTQLIHWALAAALPKPTLQQALNSPDAVEWQEAIDYELSQLEKLEAWEVVDVPRHANIIPCHYVLATKRSLDSEKLKLHARLVANGQRQKHGLDYSETFTPTTNMPTIRTVLAMATQKDWEVQQVDIKSAYLHTEIKEDIYMRAPPGYLKAGEEGKVLKLKRCLYGLKQVGFEWSEELASVFLEMGFTRSQIDQAMYYICKVNRHMVVTVVGISFPLGLY
jgi:hypothetical protein